LRRGDQDVRRGLQEVASLVRRGVARADADRRRVDGLAEPLGREGDAGEGSAEVLLHVDRERAERRDIEESRALFGILRDRLARESVEAPEERGERLSRAGRREDQRVVAGGDRRPALFLGGGRRLESGSEPLADGG